MAAVSSTSPIAKAIAAQCGALPTDVTVNGDSISFTFLSAVRSRVDERAIRDQLQLMYPDRFTKLAIKWA